jgi:hypothetical protein
MTADELRATLPGANVEAIAYCETCGDEIESFYGHDRCFACWAART